MTLMLDTCTRESRGARLRQSCCPGGDGRSAGGALCQLPTALPGSSCQLPVSGTGAGLVPVWSRGPGWEQVPVPGKGGRAGGASAAVRGPAAAGLHAYWRCFPFVFSGVTNLVKFVPHVWSGRVLSSSTRCRCTKLLWCAASSGPTHVSRVPIP